MGRQSSAYGYSQALDGTWDDYQKEHGGWGARRDSIDDATDFMGWYFKKSEEDLGISLVDTKNQYLAYHEGRTGYRRGSHNGKGWLLRSVGRGCGPCADFTTRSCARAGSV